MDASEEMRWGVKVVLWWFGEYDLPDDYRAEARQVKRFVRAKGAIPPYTFAVVRNLLDLELINGGCDHEHRDGSLTDCDFCLWCQALILRDWMDSLLDAAGCYRSPRVEAYISHGDGDPAADEARWNACHCGCHDDCPTWCVKELVNADA